METQVRKAQQLIRAAAKTGSVVPAREAVAILQELGDESPGDLLSEAVGHVVAGIGSGQGSAFMRAIKPLDALLRERAARPAPPRAKTRKKARKKGKRRG